jgi:hypothetical protein
MMRRSRADPHPWDQQTGLDDPKDAALTHHVDSRTRRSPGYTRTLRISNPRLNDPARSLWGQDQTQDGVGGISTATRYT